MRTMTHFLLWAVGLSKAESQTTEAERACLVRHAQGRRRLVEVGVWEGATTRRLRAAMADDGILYAVDTYRKGRLGFSTQQVIAQREVERVPRGSVEWVRFSGDEAARWYAQSGRPAVEFVFIDADHSYEALRADWEGWSPLVVQGGVVALHDSRSYQQRDLSDAGSAQYTRDVNLKDPGFEEIEAVDSLTVMRRR